MTLLTLAKEGKLNACCCQLLLQYEFYYRYVDKNKGTVAEEEVERLRTEGEAEIKKLKSNIGAKKNIAKLFALFHATLPPRAAHVVVAEACAAVAAVAAVVAKVLESNVLPRSRQREVNPPSLARQRKEKGKSRRHLLIPPKARVVVAAAMEEKKKEKKKKVVIKKLLAKKKLRRRRMKARRVKKMSIRINFIL